MKNNLLFLLIASIVLLGCRKNNQNNGDGCYLNSTARSITHDGLNREYIVYVPNSYNGSSSVPLLLNFHGFGGSASEYMLDADLRSLAESDTFIVAYPQGSCLNNSSHWNACPIGGDNKSSADDFGFVEAMVNEISNDYAVDLQRIYACGYSNGGMMAYGLANYKSDLIAAVGSVSGVMLDCAGTITHPMPVVHLHGTDDGVLPYNGSNDYSSTQDVLDYWIAFNNTSTTPIVSSDNSGGMTIEHYQYNQGDSAVAVEHYKYIGGDHVWFNTTYQGQNTAELIWNFVSMYDINGLR
ncbi:MAG: hypothetical protein CMD01_01810 [Flavobacteriales bacterium]|nr:hypothetical protein [Flavobacteriales bacterium]